MLKIDAEERFRRVSQSRLSAHEKRQSLKKNLLPVVLIGVLMAIIAAFVGFGSAPQSKSEATSVASTDAITPVTVGKAWRWDRFASAATTAAPAKISLPDSGTDAPFDPEMIYRALQAVKLDDHGDVIVDNDALIALNQTVDSELIRLDERGLYELQELIKVGLPGKAGEQTAKIVADYYHYSAAEKEFNALHAMEAKVDNYEAQYQEVVALREVYLGSDVASALFAVSDANARYMFDMMQVDSDVGLSEDEKSQKRRDITERHTAATIGVTDWNARYRAFETDKQAVLKASLSDAEKQSQVNRLMQQHFSTQELEKVKHLNLGSP